MTKRAHSGESTEIAPTFPETWNHVNGKPFDGPLPDGKPVDIPEEWKLPPEMRGQSREREGHMTVVEKEQQAVQIMIPLDRIVSRLPVRRLSAAGIARIQESMRWAGFLENYPLTVTPLDGGTYDLIDGSHRYEAAKSLGIDIAPCVVKDVLGDAERYMLAFQSNGAAEAVVPSTLVTYAEFIWARIAEEDERGRKKYTHADIGKMIAWDKQMVFRYAALRDICDEAWSIISATFEKSTENGKSVDGDGDSFVDVKSTVVDFSENLLRNILPLKDYPTQQVELCRKFATDTNFSKGKFKSLAASYHARNQMRVYAKGQLGDIGQDYVEKLFEAIGSGGYDDDWKQTNHPKLHKLVASIRDEWEQKNSTRLIHGDFYEEVKRIADGSVDLILTDPPYNVASERKFTGLKDHGDISQDFGEWDKYDYYEFLKLFPVWASEWKRILRDQGSGYVFTSPEYCSHLYVALSEAGLNVKTVLVWYKSNPGQAVHQTTFKNSVEYILFFTKGKGGHTFHWFGETEMLNHINIPVCAGNERLKNAQGGTLHPTQKPIALLRHLIQVSSNGGDTVFDGFMGVGSVGAACKGKDIHRKFVGIEQDKTYFDAAQRRLAE